MDRDKLVNRFLEDEAAKKIESEKKARVDYQLYGSDLYYKQRRR